MSSILMIGLGLTILAACSRESSEVAPSDVRAERIAALDRIAAECQVPRTMFELVGEDELRLRPRPDDDDEHVDCALTKVRGNDLLRNVPMGLVGNERLDANDAAPD